MLQIEYVDIKSIKPYHKNARHNDGEATEKVAASIKAFGFQQPILVDDNNIIITGHTRLKAALSLGIDTIPIAHAVNLTDEQIKAYRLADNRVAEYSTWDSELLNIELSQFERIWQRPDFYIEKLLEFDSALAPDFSLYLDMPIAMQVWNIYRSRLIGQIMQDYGLTVIPTVSWASEESFDFCFDGLPKNSTLAISTIGVKQNKEQFEVWKNGVTEMIKRLTPKRIVVYGGKVEYDYKDIEVVYFENATTERMKESGTKTN